MKIYIHISDKYHKCIPILKYSIDKYWSTDLDITLLGYSIPHTDIENWKFISLGVDNGPNTFSSDMYTFFSKIDDEFFIFLNEDWPIMKPVNINLLEKLITKLDNNVGRIGLTKDIQSRITPTSNIGYTHIDDDIICLKQDANYRCSLLCSIWNKTYFLFHLQHNLQLNDNCTWDFEMIESEFAINDGKKILGTYNDHVIQLCHLYHRGKLRQNWYQDAFSNNILSDIDLKNIKNMLRENI